MGNALRKGWTYLDGLGRTKPMRTVKKIDINGYVPIPRYQEGDEKSAFGAVLTIVILFCMIAYVVQTFIRFVDDNPTISAYDEPVKLELVDAPDFGVIFRQNPLHEVFENENYFTFDFHQVTVLEQDLYDRISVPLARRRCDLSRWAGWLGKQAWCAEKAKFGGSYSSKNFTYLQIDLKLCIGRPECAPIDEIWRVLEDGRVNIMFEETAFQQKAKDGSFQTFFYLFEKNIYQLAEIFMRRKTTTLAPNLITRFREIEEVHINFEREKSYLSALKNNTSGEVAALTLFVRFDTMETFEERNVQTLFDLFGSWSAFFGVLGATFGFVALTWNERKFYRKNPAWDNFNDHFQSESAGTGIEMSSRA